MKLTLLIVLIGIGITFINQTRGEQTNKAKSLDGSNPSVTKEKQTELVRDDLRKLLDHNLPVVTNQAHNEVKQLNNLITSAVSNNAYSNKNFRPPDKEILKLKNEDPLASPFALGLVAPSPQNTNFDEITITHNIIESNILSDFLNQTTSNISIWHPHLIAKTHLNRELLKLNYITQNFNYNYENITHVKLWKLIKINLSMNLLIGLAQKPANNGSQLILITEREFNFTCAKTITFPQIINEFDIIQIMSNRYLVTIENDTVISFYKIITVNDTYELAKINELNLHKQVVRLKLFSVRLGKIRLIFVTEFNGQISADLYEFEIQNLFNFWLIKTIPLLFRCPTIAILDTGRDYIVAFPQKNEILVYQYENDFFRQLSTIVTENVTDVVGFSMGGYSYLAIGGLNPQILRYHRGQLHPQSILSQSFGLVEQWFPISARTYRDDLILLVQHRIKFSTHSLSVLQVLIWDGESFNIVPATPCYRNGIKSHYGITCMIDIEQETDIAGSVILQHGKNISILVPRGEEPSQLFDLVIELAQVDNPLQKDIDEFNSIYQILSTLVDNFDSSLQSIQNTIENAVNLDEYTVIPGNWEIETLEFENTYDNNTKIGTAYVGDIQISKTETELSLSYLENLVNEALIKFEESSARSKRQESTPDNNIHFEFLNGIPADELLFGSEDIIELNGIQEFERSIYVGNDVIMGNDSKINGLSIREDTINTGSEDIVLPTIECDEIEIFESLLVMDDINGKEFNKENMGRLLDDGTRNTVIVENMLVGGDLNFTRINNVDFGNFIDKIVFKNKNARLEKLIIDGVIFVETEFGINNLNDIPFPDGFVFENSTSQQEIIRGHKVFTQILATQEIDTDGQINGIQPSHVVTLGDEQFIPGEITFSHVEVSESLEVNGTIKGQNLDTFLANPTIMQTNVINSSCIFNELEVEGNVYLVEMENENLESILEDVVYNDQPDEFVNINALKMFDTVYVETNKFTVTSNLVNNKFGLNKYLSKSRDQILSMNYLNGSLKFNTLTLTGLFNGINITELDLNSIKTRGDQYIDKRIKFQQPISAKNLKILEKINKKSVNQLINTKLGGNVLIHSNFEVEHLEIDQLSTNGNIQSANGEVNGVNLNEFNQLRFSLSRPQTIPGIFLFKSATVEGDLSPNFLNDVNLENFNSLIEKKQSVVADIFSGKVPIRHIIVKGNITINNINGYNMDKIIHNVIWLDRPNTISNRLTFLDEVQIHGDLDVLSRVNNNFNLNTVFDHVIYRDDHPIIIDEKKIFTNGIIVYGNCTTEYINDVAIWNHVISNQMNYIKNKIIINGNLQVNDLNAPYINDLKLSELTSLYHFDENSKTHYLNIDNVQFTSPQETPRLYVNGSINDLFNVDEFLKNMVQLDKPIHFDGNLKVFQSNIRFTKNLIVENLNSINLNSYFERLVYIDEKEPVIINGNIEFVEEITVNHLRVGGDLITKTILGYDPNQWFKNQFFVNENVHVQIPLQFERGTFHATAMSVQFLNGIDMSKVLTYNTEQLFKDDFIVSEIVSFVPVRVHGLVNGLKLSNEVHNTLMRTGNTSIRIPLHIKNLKVHKSLKTPNLVNGKSLTNLLTIAPHMILSHPLHFNEIETPTIIKPDYYLSGIDFSLWYVQSLWKVGRETQTVVSKYTISNVAVGAGGMHGTGLVNNKSMNEIVETRNRDQLKLVNELLQYRKEIEFICRKLNHLIRLSTQQIYYVKYFNARIMLENENSKIAAKLFFVLNFEKYLLISSTDCHSTIYRWDSKQVDFHEVLKFQSGYVSDWRQIYNRNSHQILLVSNAIKSEFECNKSGVYLFRFNGSSIIENSGVLINPEHEIRSLWTSEKFEKKLFLITEGLNREPNVFQIDENGKTETQWKLPINHRRLQFLPTEFGFQLALSDGNQIYLINDFPLNSNRVKRHHWDTVGGLLKRRPGELLNTVNNGIQKISMKNEENFKRKLFDLNNENAELGDSYTTETSTSTEPEPIVGEAQGITTSPVVGDPSNSKTFGNTVERIIDNIFNSIVKISDKSVKGVQEGNSVGSTPETQTPNNLAETISNKVLGTTLNLLSTVEETASQVVNNEEVGGSFKFDKENLANNVDVGYPHVKNIAKDFVVTATEAISSIKKLDELLSNFNTSEDAILNSESVTTLQDGYMSIEKLTKNVFEATANTVANANKLANKFELIYDQQDSKESNITTRAVNSESHVISTVNNTSVVRDSVGISSKNDNSAREFGIEDKLSYKTINGSTKTNGSIDVPSLDILDEAIVKQLEKVTDNNISEIEDRKAIIHQIETVEATAKNDSEANEFVIAPNPSYAPHTGLESSRNITTNNSTDNISRDTATTDYPKKDFKFLSSDKITNNSMVGTSLDSAYAQMEKIAKVLVDAGIKNVADFEDFKQRINHLETVGDPSMENESSTNKFDRKPSTNQPQYSSDANPFKHFGSSSIGDKMTKTNPPPMKNKKDDELDQIIGQEITYHGVIASENNHIPEKGTGELVVLYVGKNENRRMLTAVSTKTNTSTIPGKHDTIKIYDDILEGKIYQELHTSKPTGLTALHIGDQTMLAYLEDNIVVQLYVYHGIEGFKHFNEFKLPKHANHLSSTTLSGYGTYACPRHFLIVTFTNKLWFLEAIMEGDCGVNIDLDCGLPLRSIDKV